MDKHRKANRLMDTENRLAAARAEGLEVDKLRGRGLSMNFQL